MDDIEKCKDKIKAQKQLKMMLHKKIMEGKYLVIWGIYFASSCIQCRIFFYQQKGKPKFFERKRLNNQSFGLCIALDLTTCKANSVKKPRNYKSTTKT